MRLLRMALWTLSRILELLASSSAVSVTFLDIPGKNVSNWSNIRSSGGLIGF